MLLVINGAPGVGKTTLAHLYSNDRPLSLVVDIDTIRRHLGRWSELSESRLVARDLSVDLTRAHLLSGYDVIIPQYLARPEFLDRLRTLAGEVDVAFVEVILTDSDAEIVKRFRLRRSGLTEAGSAHPEADLRDDEIATEIPLANERLLREAASRDVLVVSTDGGIYASYRVLCRALGSRSDPPERDQ